MKIASDESNSAHRFSFSVQGFISIPWSAQVECHHKRDGTGDDEPDRYPSGHVDVTIQRREQLLVLGREDARGHEEENCVDGKPPPQNRLNDADVLMT